MGDVGEVKEQRLDWNTKLRRKLVLQNMGRKKTLEV